MSTLSPRQLQVLRLIAAGHDTPAIARQLHVSQSTVRTTRANLFEKLGVHNAPHAIAVAYHRGILAADPEIETAAALLRTAAETGHRLALVPWETR